MHNLNKSFITSIYIFFSIISVANGANSLDKSILKLSSKINNHLPDKSVALVVTFQNLEGQKTLLGKYIADQVQIELVNNYSITVVERDSIKTSLKERSLAESGLVNEGSAINFGKALGANAVIYGTLTEFKKKIEVNAKVVDIEKGITIGGAKEKIKRTKEMDSLINTITLEMQEKEKDLAKRIRAIEEREKRAFGRNAGKPYEELNTFTDKLMWIMNKECEGGNPDACTWIGDRKYISGLFDFMGTDDARNDLEKACINGSVYGCYMLGVLVSNQKWEYSDNYRSQLLIKLNSNISRPMVDVKSKTEKIKKVERCAKGDKVECFEIGIMRKNWGIEDEVTVSEIFKNASKYNEKIISIWDKYCKQGKIESCTQRATEKKMLIEAETKKWLDLKGDKGKEIAWTYQKACEKGELQACEMLGIINENAKNMKIALKYYRKGCESGHPESCERIGNYYKHKKNMKKALPYFKKACNIGKGGLCLELNSYAYELPNGKRKKMLFQYACDNKYESGCVYLSEYLIASLDYEGGKRALKKLCDEKIRGRTDNQTGCYRYAKLLIEENKLDEAIDLVKPECEIYDDPDSCLTFGDALIANGQKKQGYKIFKGLCEQGSPISCEKMNAVKF